MGVHQSLSQRLVIRHHFAALNRDEVERYLQHRLCIAGADNIQLFEANAIEMMYAQARGMPRQINRLAHYALSAAAQDQARCVTLQHMTQAIEGWQA